MARVPPEKDRVNGNLKNIWDVGPRVFEANSWDEVPGLVATMFALPAVVLGIVMTLMLIGGRWPAALGVAGALTAAEIIMWLIIARTTPVEVFQPSLYGVLLVVPTLVLLTALGILLLAERYRWVVILAAATVVYLIALVLINLIYEPAWQPIKVDFTWMLLLIGGLLSLEWFTRKMLRLA
jgi:hypothetical protein